MSLGKRKEVRKERKKSEINTFPEIQRLVDIGFVPFLQFFHHRLSSPWPKHRPQNIDIASQEQICSLFAVQRLLQVCAHHGALAILNNL